MRAALLSVAAVLALAGPARALDLRSQTKSYPTTGLHQVELELPPGDLTIEAVDGDQLRLTVDVHCDGASADACERRARNLDLDDRTRDGAIALTLKDETHWHIAHTDLRMRVQVPRALALSLEFGAGDLDVYDLAGDIDVKMGAGDARFHLREGDVGAIRARVGAGDATLRARGQTVDGSGFISRTLHWSGRGTASVRVVLGAGDVDLRLE